MSEDKTQNFLDLNVRLGKAQQRIEDLQQENKRIRQEHKEDMDAAALAHKEAMNAAASAHKEDIQQVIQMFDKYVTLTRYAPLEKVVYGGLTVVLAAVLTAGMTKLLN